MLDELGTGREKKICLLPEYTCDTVILPFVRYNFEIHFYRIRKDLSIDTDWFAESLCQYRPDVILLHAYYGCDQLGGAYEILKEYKRSTQAVIIEDLTQSLFLYGTAVNRADFVACSLRKWFPVPDGGFSLRVNKNRSGIRETGGNHCGNEDYLRTKQSAQRLKLSYLQGKLIEKHQFLELNGKAEQMLYERDDLCGMSEYTKTYLMNTDIDQKKDQRKRNAEILWRGLKDLGIKTAVDFYDGIIPLYVPVYVDNREKIQKKLRENDIYAPVLWPVPEQTAGSLSREAGYVYEHLLALPCDHRYDERDMRHIIGVLEDL